MAFQFQPIKAVVITPEPTTEKAHLTAKFSRTQVSPRNYRHKYFQPRKSKEARRTVLLDHNFQKHRTACGKSKECHSNSFVARKYFSRHPSKPKLERTDGKERDFSPIPELLVFFGGLSFIMGGILKGIAIGGLAGFGSAALLTILGLLLSAGPLFLIGLLVQGVKTKYPRLSHSVFLISLISVLCFLIGADTFSSLLLLIGSGLIATGIALMVDSITETLSKK